MNVALHGLETAITTAFPASKGDRRWRPRVIRYADDLVVFHRDYDAIVQVQDIASKWLQEMGLTLKPSKTRVGHTLYPVDGTAGFDFLSFVRHEVAYTAVMTPKGGHNLVCCHQYPTQTCSRSNPAV
jgi:RNA-directed DNA polymerase